MSLIINSCLLWVTLTYNNELNLFTFQHFLNSMYEYVSIKLRSMKRNFPRSEFLFILPYVLPRGITRPIASFYSYFRFTVPLSWWRETHRRTLRSSSLTRCQARASAMMQAAFPCLSRSATRQTTNPSTCAHWRQNMR